MSSDDEQKRKKHKKSKKQKRSSSEAKLEEQEAQKNEEPDLKKRKTTSVGETPGNNSGDEDDGATSSPPSSKKAGASSIQKTYEERVKAVNIISHPLASKKSTKKVYKLVQKTCKKKGMLRRGVKELVKAVRKNQTGLAIIAGDIYPLDVISHIPIMLEEKGIPYLFVPSKFDLGAAASTKRPTSCVLIVMDSKAKDVDGMDLYESLYSEAKAYDPSSVTADRD